MNMVVLHLHVYTQTRQKHALLSPTYRKNAALLCSAQQHGHSQSRALGVTINQFRYNFVKPVIAIGTPEPADGAGHLAKK